MPARRTGLPICQHIDLGDRLLQIREQLLDALAVIDGAYPKTSREARQAHKALAEIDGLRNRLDAASATEYPGDDWSPTIYYGANRGQRARELTPILAWHRQDLPDCCG